MQLVARVINENTMLGLARHEKRLPAVCTSSPVTGPTP